MKMSLNKFPEGIVPRLAAAFSSKRFWVEMLLAAVSGVLLTLAFPPYDSVWMGWVALVPVAFLPFISKPGFWHAFGVGWVFGVVHFLSSLFWLTEVTSLGWIIFGLYLGIFPGIWLGIWCSLLRNRPSAYYSVYNISKAFGGACAWVAVEWLRGWLLTGFPWNFLGTSQASLEGLIQVAELGGVLLVSWVLAFVNLTLCLTLQRLYCEIRLKQKTKAHMEFTTAMLVVGFCFLFGMDRLVSRREVKENLTFLAVQPDIPQDPWNYTISSEESLAKLDVLTTSGLSTWPEKKAPDLVIWPETPIGAEILLHSAFGEMMRRMNRDRVQPFLLGSNMMVGEDLYNAAVLLQGLDGDAQFYFKLHLVPFGEYVPLRNWLPFLNYFVPAEVDFSFGGDAEVFHLESPEIRIAPLICFEDSFSKVARRFCGQKPDLFINLTNDGWFRRSAQSRQHLNQAIFRTVEFRRPMIRVSNNGITAVIDERGVILDMLRHPLTGSVHDAHVLQGVVPVRETVPTFFERVGDWVGWTGAFYVVMVALSFRFMRDGKNEGRDAKGKAKPRH